MQIWLNTKLYKFHVQKCQKQLHQFLKEEGFIEDFEIYE